MNTTRENLVLKAGMILVLLGMLVPMRTQGEPLQVEVYNGLSDTPGSADFWDTSNYPGTTNSVGNASAGAFVLGSGAASGILAGTAADILTPFSHHALSSPARPLSSRTPTGLVILVR